MGVALLVCLFLLAFAFGEICFLSSLIPVVDRQCLALVRQCREKKKGVSVIAPPVAKHRCIYGYRWNPNPNRGPLVKRMVMDLGLSLVISLAEECHGTLSECPSRLTKGLL